MRRVHKINLIVKKLVSISENKLNEMFPRDKQTIITDIKKQLKVDDEYLAKIAEQLGIQGS